MAIPFQIPAVISFLTKLVLLPLLAILPADEVHVRAERVPFAVMHRHHHNPPQPMAGHAKRAAPPEKALRRSKRRKVDGHTSSAMEVPQSEGVRYLGNTVLPTPDGDSDAENMLELRDELSMPRNISRPCPVLPEPPEPEDTRPGENTCSTEGSLEVSESNPSMSGVPRSTTACSTFASTLPKTPALGPSNNDNLDDEMAIETDLNLPQDEARSASTTSVIIPRTELQPSSAAIQCERTGLTDETCGGRSHLTAELTTHSRGGGLIMTDSSTSYQCCGLVYHNKLRYKAHQYRIHRDSFQDEPNDTLEAKYMASWAALGYDERFMARRLPWKTTWDCQSELYTRYLVCLDCNNVFNTSKELMNDHDCQLQLWVCALCEQLFSPTSGFEEHHCGWKRRLIRIDDWRSTMLAYWQLFLQIDCYTCVEIVDKWAARLRWEERKACADRPKTLYFMPSKAQLGRKRKQEQALLFVSMLDQTMECGLPEDQDLGSSLRVLRDDARSILDKMSATTEWQKECLEEIFKLTEAEVRLKTAVGGEDTEVLVLMYLGVSHTELASYSNQEQVLDLSQIPEIQTEKSASQPEKSHGTLFQDPPQSSPLNAVQALDHERQLFIHPGSHRMSEANQPFQQDGDSVSLIVGRTGINSTEESSFSDMARPADFIRNTTNYGPGSSEIAREALLEMGTLPSPTPEMERILDTSNGRPDNAYCQIVDNCSRVQHAIEPRTDQLIAEEVSAGEQHFSSEAVQTTVSVSYEVWKNGDEQDAEDFSMTAEEGETERRAGDQMDNSLENESNSRSDDRGDIETTLGSMSSSPFPQQTTPLKVSSTSSEENSMPRLSSPSTQQVTQPIIVAVPLRGKPQFEGSSTSVQHTVGFLSCTDSATMEENIGAMEKLIDACKRALVALKESETAVERRKKDLAEAQGLTERRREELRNAEAAEKKHEEEIILVESAHRQKQEEADKTLESMGRWQQT